jgi:hypothetical protein
MSKNSDVCISKQNDDPFLNYNGFNNIKKSTSHTIKNKKNGIKLCDINKNCVQIEFNIKNKNLINNTLNLLNSDNNIFLIARSCTKSSEPGTATDCITIPFDLSSSFNSSKEIPSYAMDVPMMSTFGFNVFKEDTEVSVI